MVVINNLYPEVIKMCRPLIVEDEVLKVLSRKFSDSISKSLSAEYVSKSTVKCNLTHVTDFPDGTEQGSFIGLEFSGRVFRLVHVTLKGDRFYNPLSRLYEFSDQKLTENLSKVMDYVARCVSNFIETHDLFEEKTILGVASPFPMEQESLQESNVVQWGKDFQCQRPDKDFFMQLKLSLKKFKYSKGIYLISHVSNSTACLLSAIYKDPATRIGLYLGDDTSISYVERYKNMTAHTGDGLRTRTTLGVEMKNFGDDGLLDFIRTEFDFEIDAASSNPGQFVLEKLVSGTYLGDITRLCLLKLACRGIILDGQVTQALKVKDALKTSDIASMEMEEEKKFSRCRAIMRKLGYKEVSAADCLQIRFVGRCVARRSSNLVAACLVALIQRMESKTVRIMADGFLLKDFPNYEYYLLKKMNQLKKPDIQYLIQKAEKEEVAVGAGLVALIYKDAVIKMESKHRALPPFDPTKYNLDQMPASCDDCRPARTSVQIKPKVIKTRPSCDTSDNSSAFLFPQPGFPISLDV